MRPFGVSLLMAGHDTHGPQLYQIDPSGSYFAWKASAIGKNMTNAKTFLEKRYSEARSPCAWRSLSPRRPTVRYPEPAAPGAAQCCACCKACLAARDASVMPVGSAAPQLVAVGPHSTSSCTCLSRIPHHPAYESPNASCRGHCCMRVHRAWKVHARRLGTRRRETGFAARARRTWSWRTPCTRRC